MNAIKEVRDFVVENFLFGDAGALQDDTSFMQGGIIDSTGILELVAFLEATYHLKVENEEMIPENLDSISNVARFIAKKTGHIVSGASSPTEASSPAAVPGGDRTP